MGEREVGKLVTAESGARKAHRFHAGTEPSLVRLLEVAECEQRLTETVGGRPIQPRQLSDLAHRQCRATIAEELEDHECPADGLDAVRARAGPARGGVSSYAHDVDVRRRRPCIGAAPRDTLLTIRSV